MLQEKQRITQVSGIAIDGEYTYDVSYSLNGSQLTSLNCGVNRKIVQEIPVPGGGMQPSESVANIGNMARENGVKRFNFPDNEDITPHIAVFDQIISEIQEAVAPISEKKTNNAI